MKTVITERIDTYTDQLRFGYWDEEGEEFVPLTEQNAEGLAMELGCTVEMIEALRAFTVFIVDAVSTDLRNIWKRLDKLEEQLKGRS